MKATLEREGIRYVENTQPEGRIQLLCNDPDGNTLEFQPASRLRFSGRKRRRCTGRGRVTTPSASALPFAAGLHLGP
jgi:hypothetical protein